MKEKDVFYNKEFHEVLNYCKQENLFLGEGTPNADILIVGKECGLDAVKGKSLKAVKDKGTEEQVKEWILNNSQNEIKSNLDRLRDDYLNKGLPRLKKDIGYNATWSNYHRLVSLIKGVSDDQITKGGRNDWGFLDSCFITEVSQLQLPNSNYLKDKTKSDNIAKRSEMFRKPFFRRFPIVIVAVGPHYISNGKYKYNFDIERDFDVKFINTIHVKPKDSDKNNKKTRWYNVHKSTEGTPRLVIHTRQLSTVGEPNESLYTLMDEIANTCKEFMRENF